MLFHVSTRFDKTLLQAAMTLTFFGCFRLGEICIPDNVKFDSNLHLCLGDVTFDHASKSLEVFLKRSKTDTTNAGISVHVGCSRDKKCCAFCFMVTYVKFRSTLRTSHAIDAPLFLVPGGRHLTKSYMISVTRLLLGLTGHNPALYSGHSYRAGAATTAGDNKFKEWELKMLGRRSSNAYSLYLRNPRITSSFAARLASLD